MLKAYGFGKLLQNDGVIKRITDIAIDLDF